MNKNRSFTFLICIFYLLAFLVAGCGDLKIYSDFKPPEERLNKYKALEIADFEAEIPNIPQGALVEIPNEVQKLLASKRGEFEEVKREAIEDISPKDTLILLGTITDYQSGTNVKMEGGAIKFGESGLAVRLSLVEEDSGREIASGIVSGFSSLGLFRRGIFTKDVYQSIAEEIAKFISENH